MNKEKWIDQVINASDGMLPAIPPGGLFENTLMKINKPGIPVKTIALPAKRWAAAAILLLAMNISALIYAITQNTKTTNTTKSAPLAAEMQLGSTYNY